jgi:hypothetical protein
MSRSHSNLREFIPDLPGTTLGLSEARNLVHNGIPLSKPACDASITVSAEGATQADTRDIVIQLKDADGNNIDYNERVDVHVMLDGAGVDFVATGGSTGIQANAAAAAGKLLTVLAKKIFAGITNSSGALNLRWVDTGTETAFLEVRLPNGRRIFSTTLVNA